MEKINEIQSIYDNWHPLTNQILFNVSKNYNFSILNVSRLSLMKMQHLIVHIGVYLVFLIHGIIYF